MSYIYETLLKSLGGSKVIGRDNMDYGSWTPQGLRAAGIVPDAIIVEYHKPYNSGKIAVFKLDPATVYAELTAKRTKYPFTVFEHKKFSALEELFIDQSLTIDLTRYVSRVDPRSRLRAVSQVAWKPETSVLVSRLGSRDFSNPSEMDALFTEVLGARLGVPSNIVHAGPGFEDWPRRYTLAPAVYSSDVKGGDLQKHFESISIAHGYSKSLDESESEVKLTSRQESVLSEIIAQINKDSAKIGEYNDIKSVLRALTSSKWAGAGSFGKALYRAQRHGQGTVPGLLYCLNNYVHNEELESIYGKLGMLDYNESLPPSRLPSDMPEGGWLVPSSSINRAIRDLIRSRESIGEFVPDRGTYPGGVPGVLAVIASIESHGGSGEAAREVVEEGESVESGDSTEATSVDESVKLAIEFVEAAFDFSNLKRRMIGRIAASREGVPSLASVSDEHGKVLVDLGYIPNSSGEYATSGGDDLLLEPGKFYQNVITSMAKLSDNVDYEWVASQSELASGQGGYRHACTLDEFARNLLGFPSRKY